ncbi:PHB depolymerase family esterase [Roseomonas terrae]|jgi:poly(hydroxyalkanoate) depolymerase family esterase|uniref:PHB depolymerase family esterase n=1 Tax=Neoroseomonas terrae TaxID=424799 RepID=A0ABS5EC69_9PROT|nr:PHB depolymerase family esterase [Neoroseomonas terrae]MBR0648611.1 PHB depolymerase family esterase [Neoroseomonas terrae]
MNAFLSDQMREATRLTRAGRLTEASELMQRALRGAAPVDAKVDTQQDQSGARAANDPHVVDIDPETGEIIPPNKAGMDARRESLDRSRRIPFGVRAASHLRAALGGLRPGFASHVGPPATRPSAPVPDGARFERLTFRGPSGNRDYKLYIPSHYNGDRVPLIVMLHGCTQSADDFAAGTRMNDVAEEMRFLVLYPEQSKAANAHKCWNWFNPGDQRRDQGEPAMIAGMVRQIGSDYSVDHDRIYVAGLSAGGAAAAIMAQTYPDLFAAVGVHSGLPCGAARDVPTAFAAMRDGARASQHALTVPTIAFHADNDTTVHPRNADLVIARNSGLGAETIETHSGQVPGGREYTRTVHLTSTGNSVLEQWRVHGGGHAWSGGSSLGSYTDPLGPDASREIVRFFLQHPRRN